MVASACACGMRASWIGCSLLDIDMIVPLCDPPAAEPDYSRVLYPNPPSHDFCVWLILAELMRREHNAPAPLKVTFLMQDGQLGKMDFACTSIRGSPKFIYPLNLDREYSDQMLANVLRPAINMIGAVNEPDLHTPISPGQVKNQCEYPYFCYLLVDCARAGYKIPQWTIPAWPEREVNEFLRGEKPVIITLRESSIQRERNSQIAEWMRFAESIEKDFPILFIRDTSMANYPLSRWRTWPRASTCIEIRAALYQHAYCNLMVGNGPQIWATFSPAPYLLFKQLIPALPDWQQGTELGWKVQEHMEVGDNWPWAGKGQRITWKDDTFSNISAEFKRFREKT